MRPDQLIVFYDGQCPFCICWVKFLLDRDGYNRLRFASLQSDWTYRFFKDEGLPHPGMESVVVWDGSIFHFGSAAILTITAALPGAWKYLRWGRFIPRKLRDSLYGWIARNRSNWLTPHKSCWIPKEEDRQKFPDLTQKAQSHYH